jgi:hypothetical protein
MQVVKKPDDQLTPQDLIQIVSGVCAKEGFPVEDDEYRSAVCMAVAVTLSKQDSFFKAASRSHYACRAAIKLCKVEAHKRIRWENRKRAASRPEAVEHLFPSEHSIAEADYNLLEFVACHGKVKAARLLGIRTTRLRSLLLDIQLRLRQ